MSALPTLAIIPDGTALIRCTDWLGLTDWTQWARLLVMCIILCGLVGLLYVWCDLNRMLAGLYEMKCLQEEWNSEHDQCYGEPPEPASERDKRIRLHVKLRRKAFLLRRNADKLDNLLLKPLRRLGLFLRDKCVKAGALIRMIKLSVIRRDGGTGRVLRQIDEESLDVTIHKTHTRPNK